MKKMPWRAWLRNAVFLTLRLIRRLSFVPTRRDRRCVFLSRKYIHAAPRCEIKGISLSREVACTIRGGRAIRTTVCRRTHNDGGGEVNILHDIPARLHGFKEVQLRSQLCNLGTNVAQVADYFSLFER